MEGLLSEDAPRAKNRLLARNLANSCGAVAFHEVDVRGISGRIAQHLDDSVAGGQVVPGPQDGTMVFADSGQQAWRPVSDAELGVDSPRGRGRPSKRLIFEALAKTYFPEGLTVYCCAEGADSFLPYVHEPTVRVRCAPVVSLPAFARQKHYTGADSSKLLEKVLPGYGSLVMRHAMIAEGWKSPLEGSPNWCGDSVTALKEFSLALAQEEGASPFAGSLPHALLTNLDTQDLLKGLKYMPRGS